MGGFAQVPLSFDDWILKRPVWNCGTGGWRGGAEEKPIVLSKVRRGGRWGWYIEVVGDGTEENPILFESSGIRLLIRPGV
ncbi:hypothetical protein CEXT_590391 [Caerostris extrusa]|uniref:Uncharacterized protein n=1 Tax=Caerostris extrusa TaxID=172846 RepID=A0AAV4UUF2_CAEEX|nr:hypothetical protein CEXT_590391 [Caerostris extrusa]